MYPTVVHWGWNSGKLGCYSNPDDPSTLKWVECNSDAVTIVEDGNQTFECYNKILKLHELLNIHTIAL